MFEKNLKLACLLDFYGEVLSERKQSVLSLYYNEDLSLAEIAEEIGISRQGVRDLIKKAEEELLFLEEKLGLEKKLNEALTQSDKIFKLIKDEQISEKLSLEMETLVNILKQ
ncbi:MAG: winged helix-turn-helix transcriptional regulator [Clostridia bacterium]|nr:winged helix-turn-helix transcriptional regulator [Clostridia bacterium]